MAAWRNGAPTHVKTHIRKKILARDGYTCQQCGSPAAEVDHIDNTRGPGYDALSNLQSLCVPCHKAKTQREAQAGRAARARLEPGPGTTLLIDAGTTTGSLARLLPGDTDLTVITNSVLTAACLAGAGRTRVRILGEEDHITVRRGEDR